jgi:predicted DNA-binding transcriptional regulator YafY
MPSEPTISRLRTLLNTGKEFTLDELSDQLEISRRHVRRLINEMRSEGLTVTERREGLTKRFYLAAEDRARHTTPVDLRESELLALSVAVEAARSALSETPLAAPLQEAADKIMSSSPARVITFEPERTPLQWHFAAGAKPQIDPDIFAMLTQAVRACETVAIDYVAASSGRRSTDRRIDPYLVARVGSTWLLTARCHESRRVLDFSIAAVEAAQPTGRYFQRPQDFDPELHYRDRFRALDGAEVHIVRLQVREEKAPHFRNKTYHPTQQIERTLDSGDIIVSYEVSGLDEIAAFVRAWGPDVTVLAPPALSRRIQRDLHAALEAYQPS